ncbi:unnamed protein product, partial [marine sediment metagenome]
IRFEVNVMVDGAIQYVYKEIALVPLAFRANFVLCKSDYDNAIVTCEWGDCSYGGHLHIDWR